MRSAIITAAFTAAAGIALLPSQGHALTIDANLYCSAPTYSGSLSTSDVTLDIGATHYTASDCYGPYPDSEGNPPASIEADLDAIWGDMTILDKSDTGGVEGFALGGVLFEVTADEATSGSWTVTWTDVGGNLPFTVDFGLVLKGGELERASYLLSDVLIPIDPTMGTGTFVIAFLNAGGNNPDLSFLGLGGRIVETPPTPNPEPGTLTLLGLGLLGLAARRRRTRRT